MISNSIDGIYIGRASSIRVKLKLNIYVYNEAIGRLKAIGFTSEVKQFNKAQLSIRNDDELYYRNVNPERHPGTYLDNEEAKELLNKRSKKLKKD